jgi:Zn finger protein HypA/HybF involved in hydrogenase expression
MHEAGLAAAVAAEIRERRLDARLVRLLVHGGHGATAAFDAALRIHLALLLPEADVDSMTIVHLPTPRLCVQCTGLFEAIEADAPCPRCHGASMSVAMPEWIDLEWEGAAVGDATAAVRRA